MLFWMLILDSQQGKSEYIGRREAGGREWEAERWFDFFLFFLFIGKARPIILSLPPPLLCFAPIRVFHFQGSESVHLEGPFKEGNEGLFGVSKDFR